jgi:hypothetical protein
VVAACAREASSYPLAMSARCLGLLVTSLASIAGAASAGCAHPRASAAQPAAATPSTLASAPCPQLDRTLHDLVWQLSFGERGAIERAPEALHSFTVGRWECALGAVEARDALSGDVLTLERSRRVACTHASGATVQSELRCTHRMPGPSELTRAASRELILTLDTMPPVRLTCEASPVTELTLRNARDQAAPTRLCQGVDRWQTCSPSPTP